MITSIHIENFKSIQSLDLELGRLNVFIGANGSGKSNILEAIAMGSAAMEDKLDDEFLVHRGVRVTAARMMKSGFDIKEQENPIQIIWSNEFITYGQKLTVLSAYFSEWEIDGNIENLTGVFDENIIGEIQDEVEEYRTLLGNTSTKKSSQAKAFFDSIKNSLDNAMSKDFYYHSKLGKYEKQFVESAILKRKNKNEFLNFLIYAPENHFLRRFEEEAAIKPLGIKGEGLFKLITIIAQEYPDQFNEIKQHLKLIDWFEDFEIPGDLKFTERRIKIKDQYLADDLQYFDQRSANEGFLYLLFYLTLFVSDLTPHFFAIDNIDNALNPKLGSELIKVLSKLSKEHNKQALLTTHNPVILDGLDLNDDDQRLFVVYRNADGHTKVRRIPPRKPVNGIEPVRLSEAFIRGYIGGIPDNF